MNKNIDFEKGVYGCRAVIKSAWHNDYLKILLDKDIAELELNQGKGWGGEDLKFLQFLPRLQSFSIFDFSIKSIDDIHCLHNLRKTEISTYCKTPIDFKSFPNLLECGFEWRKGSDSLFDCKSLSKLFINNYDKKTSDVFSQLIKLEKLSILNAPIENLRGLKSLKMLKFLRIGNLKKLNSFQGIEELEELEELEVQKCKAINSISELSELKKLKRLLLLDMGDIESLKVLGDLDNLEVVLFYGSTNIIDGDISPLTRLKNLSKVSFQNRKHYTHRREDFGTSYSK